MDAMKLIPIALASALLTIPQLALAADEDGQYAIRGIGSYDCSTVLEQIADESTRTEAGQIYNAWISGYLSAINRTEQDTFDIFPTAYDQPVLMVALAQCQQSPEMMFEEVILSLASLFYPARVTAHSPLAPGEVDELIVREEVVRKLQQRLIHLGFLDGEADGVFGVKSRQALRDYRLDRGDDAASGSIDISAIAALLLPEVGAD